MKRFVVFLMILVMITQAVSLAYAADNQEEWKPSYTYLAVDGTTYGKLSHPKVAPNNAFTHVNTAKYDGIVDYLGQGNVGITGNSEGDRGLAYPWAAASYGKYLYVGTSQSMPAQGIGLISSLGGLNKNVVNAAVDALFNGSLYFHEKDRDPSTGEYYQPTSVVVKINVEDPSDIKIIHSGVSFRSACVVGDRLYFCGTGGGSRPVVWMFEPENGDKATLLFRGASPATYTTMAERQLDAAIRGICNYNGHCVFSYLDNEEVIPGKKGSGKIYVLRNNDPVGYCIGDPGEDVLSPTYLGEYRSPDVVRIADQADLFDYPCLYYFDSNVGGGIHEMIEFNDYLYVSCVTGTEANGRRPFAVVKAKFDVNRLADCGDTLDVHWNSVIGDKEKDGAKYTFGIDPSRTRAVANNIMVFDDHLYIGEYNDQMYSMSAVVSKKDLTVMAKNMEDSVNLYRLDKNDRVEMIVGDPTPMFPGGGVSGRGSGYGNGFHDLGAHTNVYTWQMVEFDGKLYLGTYDNASCIEPIGQFSNGDILHWNKADWKNQIEYILTLIRILLDKNEDSSQLALTAAAKTGSQRGALSNSTIENRKKLMRLESILKQMLEKSDCLEKAMDQTFLELFQNWKDEFNTYLAMLKVIDPATAKAIESAWDLIFGIATTENVEAALYMSKLAAAATRGFDFYCSEDGVHFSEISRNGFGDPYNYGVRIYGAQNTPENKWLVIGAANPFYGAQLWKLMGVKPDPSCTVTFNMNGYGLQVPDQIVKPGGKVIKPVDPVASKAAFGGWYRDAKCETAWDFDTDVVTCDTVLYAKWIDIPKTGDTNNIGLWVALMAAAALGMVACVAVSRRRENGCGD